MQTTATRARNQRWWLRRIMLRIGLLKVQLPGKCSNTRIKATTLEMCRRTREYSPLQQFNLARRGFVRSADS